MWIRIVAVLMALLSAILTLVFVIIGAEPVNIIIMALATTVFIWDAARTS